MDTIEEKINPVRIAVQSSGRLRDQSLDFIRSLGLEFVRHNDRALVLPCLNAAVELVFVRHGDIPGFVGLGTVDYGIAGEDLILERSLPTTSVRPLGFGACSLVVAVPASSPAQDLTDLAGKRIATTYPNCLERALEQAGISATIFEIKGSVEAAPALGLADAICDITQTGSTLRANGLRQITTVFSSEAVLIESPFASKQKSAFSDRFVKEAA